MLAFQCRNPIHKAHYELFIRALEADNVGEDAVCLVHPTCGPTQVCVRVCVLVTTVQSKVSAAKLQSGPSHSCLKQAQTAMA